MCDSPAELGRRSPRKRRSAARRRSSAVESRVSVMVATTGIDAAHGSGPPVAESASAASHSARTQRSTASSRAHVVAVAELDDRAGVQAARTGGDAVALLVAAAGDVVGEQAAHAARVS